MTSPLATAAATGLARDELWRNPPPLTPGCDHDLLCLHVIEARQTVLCRKCGGLDPDASRRVLTEPGTWTFDATGTPVRLLESGPRITYQEAAPDLKDRVTALEAAVAKLTAEREAEQAAVVRPRLRA